jgi:hypothetical protein
MAKPGRRRGRRPPDTQRAACLGAMVKLSFDDKEGSKLLDIADAQIEPVEYLADMAGDLSKKVSSGHPIGGSRRPAVCGYLRIVKRGA